MRDQRAARDLSIDDVAARLRIRGRYLEAIEQGRFDQLPGAAYIPAFLRAYANFLGLDADKVMTAYQLSGPVPIERPVTLPADFPIVEKRAPVGLAVLTVLLVIGAGYAVWQYMPRQEAVVSQKVPPVPDRLLANQAPATPPAAQPAAPAIEQAATPPAAQPAAPPVQDARTPPPTPAVPPANEMWPAPKQETAAKPANPMPAVSSAPAQPPVVMPSPGQAQAAQAPVVEAPRAALAPNAVAVQPLPPQQEAAAPPPVLLATPAAASDTRVVARTNSWIELRGPAGDVLTQTYVRAGESYVVPAGISYRLIDAR
ncbi:MAG: helix-turn-helix domain-containing protein [Reyranella sp.]|uniref:helix-turn-helix domain-containing protein n=1 Tax=Reyranella sp. TaxID=1929291 RepID=UPI001AC963DC|nr:helix-turn-helix domain-containing protein [Reyranella sp.]MBN9086225.1 helix-turn-helix domain-containing protein [Reyranella sp.]